MEARGINAKSRNNLYYHISERVRLGLVPAEAIRLNPRAVISDKLLEHIRLTEWIEHF